MTSHIVVIVVNYATANLAIAAVESVLAHDHGGRRITVYLVDNASPGDDADTLRKAHTERNWAEAVTLWLESENHGFGRANNLVLKALTEQQPRPDMVFLLNPDAHLQNEAIDFLATTLETTPDAAAAGSGVLRPDMTPTTAAFQFPNPISEIVRTVRLGFLDRLAKPWSVPLPADHAAGPVDWVSGSSVMFRFEAIEQVGFFDQGFFLYYEEVDLMRRLHEAGWSVIYIPKAHVVHEEGAATGQFAARQSRRSDPPYLYDSWAHYFARAFGRAGALAIAFSMMPAALLNMLHRGVRGLPPTVPKNFLKDQWRLVIRPLLSGRPRL